jgi:hypothetical protein
MDEPTFWRLIEAAQAESGGDGDEQAARLQEKLEALPADEIIAFDTLLDEIVARAYRNDLWAAAYVINGGCSDDCFEYFRGWLIAQGERVFNDALRDPEETLLTAAGEGDIENEAILYAAYGAYEAKTGQEMPFRMRPQPALAGEAWDEETVDTLYPRLAAKFWPQQ